MKKIRTLLAAFLLAFTSMTANAQPMSYTSMCNNARFLTDRMAYTLGITAIDLIDDLFRINFDYICGVNDYLDDVAMGYRYNDYMAVCYERDRAIQRLLGMTIWNRLMTYDYFYRPIVFNDCRWSFGIYVHDTNIHHYYCHVPRYYNTYRGGHYFVGMRPLPGGGRGPRGPVPSYGRAYHHPGYNAPARRDGGVGPAHRGGGTTSGNGNRYGNSNGTSHNGNSGYHYGNNNEPSHNGNSGNRYGNSNGSHNGNAGYHFGNNSGSHNGNAGSHGGGSSYGRGERGGQYNGGSTSTGRGGSRIGNTRSSANTNSSSRTTRSGSAGPATRSGGASGNHRGGHR